MVARTVIPKTPPKELPSLPGADTNPSGVILYPDGLLRQKTDAGGHGDVSRSRVTMSMACPH